jgi:hypothetical protein
VNLAEPALRSRPSSGSLYRASLRSPTLEQQIQKQQLQLQQQQQREASLPHAASSAFSSASSAPSRSATPVADVSRAALLETDPPSQAYSNTSTDHPAPVTTTSGSSKMHQTSSRLLRMTSDDRPFTRVSFLPAGELRMGVFLFCGFFCFGGVDIRAACCVELHMHDIISYQTADSHTEEM